MCIRDSLSASLCIGLAGVAGLVYSGSLLLCLLYTSIACMANAHALEEITRAVIDPLICSKETYGISISSSYGAGADQVFLDSPKAEWLWEYAQDKDVLVHIHPPLISVAASRTAAVQTY